MIDSPDLLSWKPPAKAFRGAEYVAEFDFTRLRGQQARIWELMRDGKYRTLAEIAAATEDGEASISAQLRNLKNNHGVKTDKRRRGDPKQGCWEYAICPK